MGFLIPFIGVMLFVLGIVFTVFLRENYVNAIHREVEAIGGKVMTVERRVFSTGPFFLVGRGRTVYRIEYTINHTTKEGWVKFGGIGGPDWKL